MKFVVTGGAGFVGNNLVKLLVKNGHQVTVIDNLHKGKKENLDKVIDKIEFLNLDIQDYDSMEKNMQDIDGVFHQAALTVVQDSFRIPEEYHNVNVKGTENIFKIAHKNNFKVVYASSSSVYGHQKNVPILENYEKKPINPYGQTKLEDEFLAEKYREEGVSIIGLRYFNIFGKGQTGSYAGVITQFMNKVFERKELEINSNGEQVRDFIHVSDVAQANLSAMESKTEFGFFNIGTGERTSIKSLADTMIKLSNEKLGLKFNSPLKGDVKLSLADIIKTEKELDWKYRIGLKEGLKQLFED